MNKPVEHALNSYYTAERIQGELYFHMAQRIAQTLLADKLISQKRILYPLRHQSRNISSLICGNIAKTLEISH